MMRWCHCVGITILTRLSILTASKDGTGAGLVKNLSPTHRFAA
jgi:hypothetical protein